MPFSQSDAQAAVDHLIGLSPSKRRRLALDVFYAARSYEAKEPQPRPSIIRGLLGNIDRIAGQCPTARRKERLIEALSTLPEAGLIHFDLLAAEGHPKAPIHVALKALGAGTDDGKAFAEISRLVKEALSTVPADKGGPKPRDAAARMLMFTLRFHYEAASGLDATHGYRVDLADEWPEPFSKLIFHVGAKVDPWLSPAKIDDYAVEVLAYGFPKAKIAGFWKPGRMREK
jgi:hypothetical protein